MSTDPDSSKMFFYFLDVGIVVPKVGTMRCYKHVSCPVRWTHTVDWGACVHRVLETGGDHSKTVRMVKGYDVEKRCLAKEFSGCKPQEALCKMVEAGVDAVDAPAKTLLTNTRREKLRSERRPDPSAGDQLIFARLVIMQTSGCYFVLFDMLMFVLGCVDTP